MSKSKDSSGGYEDEGLTAGLAKGLRLFLDGRDVSEEGMGFGVPVIVHKYRTHLSYTAPADGSSKTFRLDAVQVVKGKKAAGLLPYVWLELKGRVYKSLPFAQKLMLTKRSTGNLTPDIGFTDCHSLCEIPVTYEIDGARATVTIDLTELTGLAGAPKVFILNEQGGRSFPDYWESDGDGAARKIITGDSVGWKKVVSDEAGFKGPAGACFSLSRIPGAPMFRGREVVDGVLSWSGIEYDVTSLIGSVFSYRVDVFSTAAETVLKT
jgi:hypothetical protein